MNLRDLRYLIALAEHQHYGEAAKACFVSQPTLSTQIKKLEDFLGVKLLERTNKRVRLTRVGEEAVKIARKIISDADSLKHLAEAHIDPLKGDFYLGAFPTLAAYYFALIVPEIKAQLPNLKLFLVEEKTDVLLQQLAEGKIDAAFIALPIPDSSLEYKTIFKDEFMLAVPETHKLKKRHKIKTKDLQQLDLLLLEEGHCLRQQALDVCELSGGKEHQTFRATSLETLRQMVASGLGITLIPKIASRPDAGIHYINFQKPAPSRDIALVWRKGTTKHLILQNLIQIAKRVDV